MSTERIMFIDCLTGETFGLEGTGEQMVPEDMPGVKGIFVGGCVSIGVGSRIHMQGKCVNAHAHIGKDPYKGWICYRNPIVYTDPAYGYVRWHEYAHILVNQGHTDKWRREMRRLGQPIPPQYAPRPRKQ